MNMSAVVQNIDYFSSLGSRIVGYPGYYDASEYIYNKFIEYGLADVTYHEFPMTIPMDYGANLTILTPEKMTIEVYPFWPNVVSLVTTPPEGITGPLIYVRSGRMKDFDNKTTDGSIVLMDFNSELNWLNAANLGAKAVIFIEPLDTTTYEANTKHIDRVPFSFPRLYIDYENANRIIEFLDQGPVTVNIKSKMKWETIKGRNIIGFLPGNELKDQYVLITTHYDSFSLIPSLSPGGESSCGISALLDLLRFYSKNPTKYTLVFVAFSGTPLGLEGSRWFLYDYVRNRWDSFGSKTRLAINLDISSRTATIFPTVTGKFYGLWEGIAGWVDPIANYMFGRTGNFKQSLEDQLDEKWIVLTEGMGSYLQWPNRGWEFQLGGGFNYMAYDAEIWTNIDGRGFTFATSGAQIYYGTPLDTPSRMNMNNINKQLRFIWAFIYSMVNTNLDDEFGLGSWIPKMAQVLGPRAADLTGSIMEYKYEEAFYSPLPNALFLVRPLGSWQAPSSLTYLGLWIVVPSDSQGKVFVPNLATSERLVSWDLCAYVIDPDTGNVIYAPDVGRYSTLQALTPTGTRLFSMTIPKDDFGIISLFKCGSLVFFDLNDPSFLNDPLDASLTLTIYDHTLQSTPIFYGLGRGAYDIDQGGRSITMVYAQDKTSIDLMVKASYASRYPLAVLVNASDDKPLGSGYGPVKTGNQIIVTRTPDRCASDFYLINKYRLGMASTIGLSREENLIIQNLLNSTDEALVKRQYAAALALGGEAWYRGMYIYKESRSKIEDSINTVPFFAFLMVPFAVMSELFVGSKGRKRLLILVLFYAIPVILLYELHPGFILASDSLTILIAMMSIILVTPVLWILRNTLTGAIKALYIQKVGVRFEKISRTEFTFEAASLGIRHMRRRGVRTALSMSTVVLIVWALVSFTSLSPISVILPVQIPWAANRDGILIQHRDYAHNIISLGSAMTDDIIGRYSDIAIVAPRAWLWALPSPTWNSFKLTTAIMEQQGQSYNIFGILGVTTQEANVTAINQFLNKGRWFIPTDGFAAIISNVTSNSIHASVADKIHVAGIEFTIIGIIDDELFFSPSGYDLNSEQLTPIDFKVPAWNVHLPPDQTIIIPYNTCIELGGIIYQVALAPKDKNLVLQEGRDAYLRYQSDIIVFMGVDGKAYAYTGAVSVVLFGWQYQVIPTILAILVLLTTNLGNVTERGGEVGILSSIGLAPSHVLLMYLSESMVYGVVGGMLGYITAMMTSTLEVKYFGLPLNYSSSMVVNTLSFAIVVNLASVIYPAIRASRTVTPSMERIWQLPKPHGDVWEISLPFMAERQEAGAILEYVTRFLEVHRSEDSPDFVVKDLIREEDTGTTREDKFIRFVALILPLDLGVSQENTINFIYDQNTERYAFSLTINHISGLASDWENVNRNFTDILRKHLLQWRALRPQEREPYYKGDQSQ